MAPCLEIINLESNNISMIQGLRKCWIPNVRFLNIAGNKVRDLERLGEIGWRELGEVVL